MIPKDWQDFQKKLSLKIDSLPITWGPKHMIFDRKDENRRKVSWMKHDLDQGQQKPIRFWLYLEILKALTGLSKQEITNYSGTFIEDKNGRMIPKAETVEKPEWPEFSDVEPERWQEAEDLVLRACKNRTEETPVQKMLSYFEQAQKGNKLKAESISSSKAGRNETKEVPQSEIKNIVSNLLKNKKSKRFIHQNGKRKGNANFNQIYKYIAENSPQLAGELSKRQMIERIKKAVPDNMK